MKKYVITGLAIAMLCTMVTGAESKKQNKNSKAEDAAVKAAEATLKLIDEGKYAESWKESAVFFKKAVKQEQWIAAMKQARKPFGKLVSRKVLTKQYMTKLPGAPAGEYVVIQFKTSFEKKKDAVETFTPMLDKDSKWRMSGYYIK